MEFEIKKEGNEKYLLSKEIKFDEHDYRIQMILNNNIKELLPIKIRNINNEKELLYDITAMTSLGSIFERSLIKKEDLVNLVLAIKRLEEVLKQYLLCGDNIKFDLNYIYYKTKQKQYCFCYCPEEVEDYNLQVKSLFNQVLDYVNYNDREAVAIAYGMQELTSRDDFAVEELLEFALESKEEPAPTIVEEYEDELEEDDSEKYEVESFREKIKRIFHKKENKNKHEEYDQEDIYIEEKENDFSFETDNLSDEDATVLLTTSTAEYIILKSTNHNPSMVIAPDKYPFVIGKSKRSCDFKVSSNVVSRVHARINYELGEFTIEDLNSTNGTFLNEDRLKPHEIKTIERGDIIKLADIEFIVE